MAGQSSVPINATGSDRPSLKDLYDYVVNNVADKWEDLGVQLLRPDQEKTLDIIAADRSHGVVSCCKRVLKKWLDTTTDATWNELIRALRRPSVELDCLADQLGRMLNRELIVTSEDTEPPSCEKLTSIQDIEVQFAKMTNRIKQALIRNDVNVVSLIEQLCAISAVKNKHVPLFDEDVFEKITSIDEFWRRLRIFWNIFDYDLLQCVVEISECREAQQILKDFLSRIDPSAIEDADLVLDYRVEHREGSPKPMLRIKVNADKCTFNVKKMVKDIVSEKFKLQKYTLCFRGIKNGCIEIFYYISKPLKLYLLQFEISENILADFLAHKILSLKIDEYKLIIPTDITKETLTWRIQQEEDTIAADDTVVMVTGVIGTGKSSTCNFLLGENIFKVGPGMMAVTSQSGSYTTVFNGRKVNIIDTPGFHKDSRDDEHIIKELDKAIVLAGNGVHAIALVVSALQPFTTSQLILEKLKFLDELWPFTFIIFSGAKSYGATDGRQRETIHKIYESPKSLGFKHLLDKVDKRFMMLDSTETNQDYRFTKLMEFYRMVDSIYCINKRLYSHLFKEAFKSYQEQKAKEKNRERPYQEALHAEQERLMRQEPEQSTSSCSLM